MTATTTGPTRAERADQACRDALARAAAGELLGPADIAAVFRICMSTYHRNNAAGLYDRLKCQHPIGTRIYSGVLVHRHVTGETLYEPTFGRKRA